MKTDDLIAQFRNSYDPRIVVTVDMIATGTDIKPLEIVLFMRSVKSRTFFEQMKGRGVRVISDTEFQAVTPDAKSKDHFVIVDAVGVCERDKTDSRPLERKRTVSLEKLLDAIAMGNRQVDLVSSLAGRLARLEQRVSHTQRAELKTVGGIALDNLTQDLLSSLNPDRALALAQQSTGKEEPTKAEIQQAQGGLIDEAVKPLVTKPELRKKIVEIHKALEQTVDTVSQDELVAAGFDQAALDAARATVQSFEQFIAEHKDEITALQVLYSRPHSRRLTLADIKALAAAIEKPPMRWTADTLWRAYEKVGRAASHVHADSRRPATENRRPATENRWPATENRWPATSGRGQDADKATQSVRPRPEVGGHRLLTDLVTLVRLALHQQSDLIPFAATVNERFDAWMTQQLVQGRQFTLEQRQWLELIRDHIAASLGVEAPDFDLAPFSQRGGLGKAYQLFGNELSTVLAELNEALVA